MPSKQRAKDLEIARAFGARVREIRHSTGMTQEQVAEAAGLHPTFISNVERGYRVPTVPTLLRLATALDTKAGAFVEDLGPS
ncbi:MAG: helix-turn-helix transcriptional regulator [Actinomycetota bacterium]